MIIVSTATKMMNAVSEGGFCNEQEELPESQPYCEATDCTADGAARQNACEGSGVRVGGSIRIREKIRKKGRALQGRAGQGRAEQNRTEQDRTG